LVVRRPAWYARVTVARQTFETRLSSTQSLLASSEGELRARADNLRSLKVKLTHVELQLAAKTDRCQQLEVRVESWGKHPTPFRIISAALATI